MPTALITGVSAGFGRAVASELIREGWTVIGDGRRPEPLAATARELAHGPGTLHAIAGDMADADHRRELIEAVARVGGPADALVLNAGALGPSPLPTIAELDSRDLSALLATNVVAQVALVQAALPMLRESAGAVVALTSDAAVEAYPGWAGYGASQAALEQVMRVLAVEEPDLRVYSLDPGDMRTDMHQAAFPGEDISDRRAPGEVAPALTALLRDRPPSGRYRAVELIGLPA